ncbi:MAG TPA: TetR/AcrR family transcriptional regulator [Solirubrobacterales bacterium]|nr:TetR/AcrR family transcriptional regulator [Solirubrobacterales bacterium]
MPSFENEVSIRKPRAFRRRPDLPPPKVEKIKPRSGLSRAEVIADQRRRILEGLALALAYHGYEDTKITDIVELAGISRPTFYEHFESKDSCFAAAYEDGVQRLSEAVEAAGGKAERSARLSAGLGAGLEFLASSPPLAHLLLVESLAAARPARLERERTLDRLAQALRRSQARLPGREAISEETARLLAGGLASHLSGRVLAGEAERLPESQGLLLQYLLAPSLPATSSAAERHAAG